LPGKKKLKKVDFSSKEKIKGFGYKGSPYV